MPSPVALLQPGQLRAQLAGRAAFAPTPALARRPGGQGRDEDGHRILAHHPWQALALADGARLPDPFPHPQGAITGEPLVAGLRAPDTVLREVVNRLTAIALGHSSSPVAVGGGLLDAVQNSGDEICPPEGGGLNLTHGQSTRVVLIVFLRC